MRRWIYKGAGHYESTCGRWFLRATQPHQGARCWEVFRINQKTTALFQRRNHEGYFTTLRSAKETVDFLDKTPTEEK